MRKKKISEEYIIYNYEKKRIQTFCPEEIPLRETAIMKKSIQFFDDPNPCCIHVNAVKVRLLEEIRKNLFKQNEPIVIKMLPKEIQEYMDLGEQAAFIEYCSYK